MLVSCSDRIAFKVDLLSRRTKITVLISVVFKIFRVYNVLGGGKNHQPPIYFFINKIFGGFSFKKGGQICQNVV